MIFGLNAGKVGGGFIMLGLCMVVIDQIEFAFMAPPQPTAGARAGKRHCSDTTMTGLEEALQMSAGGPPVNTTDIMFGGTAPFLLVRLRMSPCGASNFRYRSE